VWRAALVGWSVVMGAYTGQAEEAAPAPVQDPASSPQPAPVEAPAPSSPAQTTPSPPSPARQDSGSATLPPVTVHAQQPRRTRAAAARRIARVTLPPPPPPTAQPSSLNVTPRETAYGPVRGYVATRSAGGTKTDTPLIETPQSISVITRDRMDAQAVQSVSQALNYTSGVVAQPRGSVNGYFEFPYIRGFAPTNFLYLDGMQLLGASAGLQIEPYGLERIEVIKGPASVLYGQGPPSGIIAMVSKRPTEVPFREIMYQGGTWDRKQGAFDISGPADAEGKFLYRLTGLARESRTQVDFTEDNRAFIAPAVTWRPTADTTLTVLGQYQNAESGFFNFLPARGTFLPNPNGVISTSFYAGDPNFNRSTITDGGITYLFEHRFNEMFTVRQNYRHLDITVDADNIFAQALQPNLRTLSRFSFLNRDAVRGDTVDNQFQANIGTWAVAHTVLAGLDVQRVIEDHQTGNRLAPPIDVFNPAYYQNIIPPNVTANTYQIQRQTGFYIQDQMKVDRWVMLVGIRKDRANSYTYNRINNTITLQDDLAVTRRAGVLYLFDAGVAPYFNYSESFVPQPGVSRLSVPFKPTTGRQYEVGVKYEPPGMKALFTLAAFDIARQNVLTPDPVNPLFSVQTGEVVSKGIEAEGKLSLTDSLDVVAAYTFLNVKVTKSNGPDLGKWPVGIPENAASIWADYTFRYGALWGFGAAAGVRFIGPTWGDTINTIQVPSYTLVDAAIHYDLAGLGPAFKGYKLAVNATNLFDQTYVSSCLAAPNQCFYGLRRTVLGTVKYQW
jgi:iron complex outermembrane receptor protein